MGRPAVVPPAGEGGDRMRAPTGALAGSEALSPKAPSEGAAGLEIGALPEARLDQARWCLQAGLRAWIGIR